MRVVCRLGIRVRNSFNSGPDGCKWDKCAAHAWFPLRVLLQGCCVLQLCSGLSVQCRWYSTPPHKLLTPEGKTHLMSALTPCVSGSKGNADDSAPWLGFQPTWIERAGNTLPAHTPGEAGVPTAREEALRVTDEAQPWEEETRVSCSHSQASCAEDVNATVPSPLLVLTHTAAFTFARVCAWLSMVQYCKTF